MAINVKALFAVADRRYARQLRKAARVAAKYAAQARRFTPAVTKNRRAAAVTRAARFDKAAKQLGAMAENVLQRKKPARRRTKRKPRRK